MGEEFVAFNGGLVLLLDPVSGLMVLYCIMQHDDLKGVLCFTIG